MDSGTAQRPPAHHRAENSSELFWGLGRITLGEAGDGPGVAAETNPMMTDEQAMWRVQMLDDPQAFAELVRRWEAPIRRLGVRLLGDVHRAEDVAQEAFAKVFTHRRDFDPAARFSTWLWRIAVNLCRDELRRRERRRETALETVAGGDGEGREGPDLEVVAEGAGPAETLETVERAEAVRRALMRLPELYRVVVALRHYEGLKFHEVAEVLGVPEGTVKSRMVEALDRLERLLQPWAESVSPTKPGRIT